ncbi:MAG TPA: NAD(P)-dependent oxidoreductase [Verrucomicrobiae bacterium]|nr:NAD(P)-dependent oxidoreductase [Verrucomicrobiae bacterium]
MKSIDLQGQKVAVTGSAGVIGRELLRRLRHAGAEVLSWDREALPLDETWTGVKHVQSDLSTAELEPLKAFGPRLVFHLAAAFERSAETPEFWEVNWRDNVLVSHRLADALRSLEGVEVCVFASSYLIYSTSLYLFPSPPDRAHVLPEDSKVTTRNLCGAAKLYAEREFDFVHELARPSLRSVFARIYRVYGRGSRDIISRWVRAALQGEELRVYNRENRFDYIFAGDVAEGLLRLALAPEARGVVNLGSGIARTVQEVLEVLSGKVTLSRELLVDTGSAPPFEASCAELTRLRHLTGWMPATSLEQGIWQVVDYEQAKAAKQS